jgi:ATPase subunit of ABC transporter with duplicated ATPase domains
MSISFHHVTFAYDGAISSLFEDVTVHLAEGWTGIVGANGAGKTTFLRLAAGYLQAQQGTIKRFGHMVFCPQRTDDVPAQLSLLITTIEAKACVLRGRLQIGDDWVSRWPTLSHGERKRAQIAVALWQQPDVLLLDEPTNHIDLAARELLIEALTSFCGIGLLVSHDRDLLDLLCLQCIFLDPPQAIIRPGNYTKAAAEIKREESSMHARRHILQQNLERLTDESKRRYAKASYSNKKKSKRHLARGDSDGRAKIDLARVSGQDGQAGRLTMQLKSRMRHLQERISDIKIKKRYTTHFWIDGSVSPRRSLFTIPADVIALDGSRRLHIPEISMLRDDRIAITGENGLGKSTFIRYILDHINIPKEHLVYLPQEIDAVETHTIMSDVRHLSHEQLGKIMTVVSALGSRPERLLHNLDVSPGELRKVLLALGVIRQPYLIVMDEPTNHLDLPAIECIENALRDCPCALLLISHDLRFLSQVTSKRWHLQQHGTKVIISMEN